MPPSHTCVVVSLEPSHFFGCRAARYHCRSATALVNHRIHPADTVASVRAHDVATIADARVKVEVVGRCTEPAPVSSHETSAFSDLRDTVSDLGHSRRGRIWHKLSPQLPCD